MTKISVIMPVYNTCNRSILEKSISSILSQTHNDYELIICDDHSDDGTYELLQQLVEGIPRITLLRNDVNSGVSITRNRCINVANGEFIALQDCDDWSSLDRLEIQSEFLDGNKEFSFVGSRVCFVRDEIIESSSHYIPHPQKKDFLYTLPFNHAACMIRKNALTEVNAYRISKETVFRAEDYDMFMRMYAKGQKGFILPDLLYYYRMNVNIARKKKYRYYFHETIVRFKGFRAMNLPLIRNAIYIVKPLVSSIIPSKTLLYFKQRYFNKNQY